MVSIEIFTTLYIILTCVSSHRTSSEYKKLHDDVRTNRPKTIFFWAPFFKWGLVIAGIGDLARPVEKLSVPQTVALSATGVIWSRYSLVIIPKNYSLFSVNVFVAITQLYQLYRAVSYQRSKSAALQAGAAITP